MKVENVPDVKTETNYKKPYRRCELRTLSNIYDEALLDNSAKLLMNNVWKGGDRDAGSASGMTLFGFYWVMYFAQNVAHCSRYWIQQMECKTFQMLNMTCLILKPFGMQKKP